MGNEFRRVIRTPGDQDVHTPWRSVLAYMAQGGVTKRMKRQTNKRERREGRIDTNRRANE